MINFPHKYYFFGSEDSTDIDVVLSVESIPPNKEVAIQYMKQLNYDFNLNWNMNMCIIKDGKIVKTINSKSSIDGLNNSLYSTYDFHQQKYSNPIKQLVKRNKLLNLYKCMRTCLTNCTRIDKIHRNKIMPLKGIHPFKNKIESLKWLNYTIINSFNQRYQSDVDSWKVIAFYIGQSLSLLINDIEIYSKSDLVKHHPELFNIIYRQPIMLIDKMNLQIKKEQLLNYISTLSFENEKQENGFYNILKLDDEIIDMKSEEAIYVL